MMVSIAIADLAGLAVADDQLALAATDRHHGVDRLQTGLHRLIDRLTGDDAGGDLFDRGRDRSLDRALAVQRLAERVDDPTEQLRTDRHFQDATGALDRVALSDVFVVTQNHRTDRVALQVQRQPVGVAGKLQHFVGHDVGQTVNTDDAVGDADDRAFGMSLGRQIEFFDLALDQLTDF